MLHVRHVTSSTEADPCMIGSKKKQVSSWKKGLLLTHAFPMAGAVLARHVTCITAVTVGGKIAAFFLPSPFSLLTTIKNDQVQREAVKTLQP